MNLMDAMKSRRAVRAYSARKVDENTLKALLGAAVLAPSAMNAQPWLFAIVQDPLRLKRYSDQAKELLLSAGPHEKTRRYESLLRDPSFNVFYDASTLVVVGVAERGPFNEADCWLAAANLMLAATQAGLGTCCIGFALPLLNTPEAKQELGLPKAGAAIAPLIVGYPSVVPAPVPRAEPKVVSWT